MKKNTLDLKKSLKYSKLPQEHSKIGVIKESSTALEQKEIADISCQMLSPSHIQKNKEISAIVESQAPLKKEDLERQVEFFRCKYPNHEIIKDIGSGLNFKRKGFNSILDFAFKGDIGEVVVTHKDRLCRFGFELVLRIIESTNGKILVLDKEETSPEKELVNDILSIITVFSFRLYGLRSHAIKNKIREATSSCSENTENKTISESGGDEETQDDA